MSNTIAITDSYGNAYMMHAPEEVGGCSYTALGDGTYLVVRRVKPFSNLEFTTRLEVKPGVVVPVSVLLASGATAEQREAWESLGRLTIKAGALEGAKSEDPDYAAYEWYIAQRHKKQPLFTYAGWLKAGKPKPINDWRE